MGANLKPGAIAELQREQTAQTAKIGRRHQALAVQLRAAVPESFSVWLQEDGDQIINDLIAYGNASRKYYRGWEAGEPYDYVDLDEFARRFDELRAAWAGVVNIQIDWDGDHRFEVTFNPSSAAEAEVQNTTCHYNVMADLYVKVVPISGEEIPCPHFTWIVKCKKLATQKLVLGTHESPVCDNEAHVEAARLAVAQAFADEMMDLHGNVPEWRTTDP